jgi:hypothetical protein
MILNKPLEETETQIQPSRKTFAQDGARILRIYGGIFPDNIKQYADTIYRKNLAKKNYSK